MGRGRRGYATTKPDLVYTAKRLARRARSLRQIAAELADIGYTTAAGKAFSASQVRRLLGEPKN